MASSSGTSDLAADGAMPSSRGHSRDILYDEKLTESAEGRVERKAAAEGLRPRGGGGSFDS